MKQLGSISQHWLWSAIAVVIVAVVVTVVLTNTTLRSVEKNLPNTLLKELLDLALVLEDLADVVSAAEITKVSPNAENFAQLRRKVRIVFESVVELRNTYVFDNLIQASAFHAVVAPAIADLQVWLTEGVSGYGPETETTAGIVLLRISNTFQKAKALNLNSQLAAQKMLNVQRQRLDRFLFSVNLLFILTLIITFIMVLLLIRQRLLQDREMKSQTELQKQRDLLNSLFENIMLGITVWNRQGVLLHANKVFSDLTGYSMDEIRSLGDWFPRAYPDPDYRKHVLEDWQESTELSAAVWEFKVTCKNGEVKDVEFRGAFMPDGRALVTMTDITARKKAEEALQFRSELERMAIQLSLEFQNLGHEDIDEGINRALKKIGNFLKADRSYVFLLNPEGDKADNTHEWCSEDMEPRIDNLKNIDIDAQLPWFAEQIRNLLVVHIPNVSHLPVEAEAEKLHFKEQDIKSLIIVPMIRGKTLIGYLGFDSVLKKKEWPEETQVLLQFVSEVFTNALERIRAERALRESEEKYRLLADNATDIIWIRDMNLKLIYVSPSVEMARGYKPEEAMNQSLEEILTPESSQLAVDTFLDMIEKEKQGQKIPGSLTINLEHYCRDGSTKWMECNLTHLWDNNGKPTGILGVNRDITERKRAEEALEKRLIALTQPLDNAEGVDFEELFSLDEIQHIQDLFAKATGVASLITHPDGSPITKPSNFCRLCSDIIRKTPKGRASCYKSSAIIDGDQPDGPIIRSCLSAGLWETGANITVGGRQIANWLIGQVRDETQTEEKMLAYARAVDADEDEFLEAFREVPMMTREQFVKVAEALYVFANQLSTRAYQNIQQARFITDLKKAEDEREKLEAQLRQVQKLEAVGTLAGGVAHDFNNILQAIGGNVQLILAQDGLDNRVLKYTTEIDMAVNRATDLVQSLLASSRKVEPRLKPLKLEEEIMQAVGMLGRMIPKMIEIEAVIPAGTRLIYADASQLNQVLMNLGTNARDAMPDGGLFLIQTANVTLDDEFCKRNIGAVPGDYVKLSATDTGQGMDEETLKNIFNPFFTTKEVGKGTGLGMAVVYGIVKNHGGYIVCDSAPGQGTTFTIYWPVAPEEEIKFTKKDMPENLILGGEELILIVDDVPSILEIAEEFLTGYGYSVIRAGSGEEALEVFKEKDGLIDLVIMDLGMPGIGGHKTMVELFKMDPETKVVIASGYSNDSQVNEALKAGAAGFVGKPYKLNDLLRKIREILDGEM